MPKKGEKMVLANANPKTAGTEVAKPTVPQNNALVPDPSQSAFLNPSLAIEVEIGPTTTSQNKIRADAMPPNTAKESTTVKRKIGQIRKLSTVAATRREERPKNTGRSSFAKKPRTISEKEEIASISK